MNTFHLIVAGPGGNHYDGQAGCILLRASEGDLAVMAGHIPMMTTVKAGECRITCPDGSERVGKTDGGLLTVAEDAVTLLSGNFEWK